MHELLRRIAAVITGALGIVGIGLSLGFGISSSDTMPGYAPLYLDDESRTFLALPCIDEWQHRDGDHIAVLRLSNYKEASDKAYTGDAICRETGAFVPDGRSLSGMLLERIGLLHPLEHWWDMPYRNESGQVVYPLPRQLALSSRIV
jgi:hypothetical protein